MSASERTLVFLKPESVMRGLIGEIVSRFERKGLLLVGAKLIQMSTDQAQTLYQVHSGKPFFQDLVSHVTSAPVFVMVWQGPNAVTIARNLIGATNPTNATPGTIRGDFAVNVTPNAIHGSDSTENAERELSIFFTEKELLSYSKPTEQQFLLK
ncbi:MAG TPA: nucleoside-diphosphate kinase [Candidatus Bathyarchaeia archaeon]|nr:nucleoside-diphosphate kinase [Candidatus Bathyarchaeia archaeon]